MLARPALFAVSLLSTALVLPLAAGCGGRSEQAGASSTSNGPSALPANAPAYDADAETVANYVSGDWQVTLLPEASAVDVNAPTVDAALDVGDFSDDTAPLTGTFAGADVTNGQLVVTPGGAQSPVVSFTTDSMTVPGLTGESVEVPGPIEWTGQLYQGRLIGTAVGQNGRESRWEADRQ